jgi:hypothetical protein
VALCTLGAIMRIDGVLYNYPTPEKQSAFVRDYSPMAVIDSFKSKESSTSDASMGSGAGEKFVTNERDFRADFAIEPEKRLPLMIALRDDLSAHLIRDGAIILSSSGDAGKGFRFIYRLGRNAGSITVSPLRTDQSMGLNRRLPEGFEEIVAEVAVSEKWFPREPDSIRASLAIR